MGDLYKGSKVIIELRTGLLTLPQLQEEVNAIIEFLQSKNKRHLLVSYGWDCDLEPEQLYQESPVPPSDLQTFLAESEDDGIFMLGKNDLHIESADRSIEFTLCHESDIHMKTEDKGFAHEIQAYWATKDYPLYEVAKKK